uniref:Uncharacterized protein n=1 Tax=Ananas comosus var. bracteatus TaxID=296719 RepID=A0A6V7PEQ8_ANACO|nr:unnamed protein product [Ananas comosus var. bracteatus]
MQMSYNVVAIDCVRSNNTSAVDSGVHCLLSSFAAVVADKLFSEAVKELGLQCGVEKELDRVRSLLKAIGPASKILQAGAGAPALHLGTSPTLLRVGRRARRAGMGSTAVVIGGAWLVFLCLLLSLSLRKSTLA